MDHATKHVQCVQIRGLPGSCPHNMPNYPPKRVDLSGGGGGKHIYIYIYTYINTYIHTYIHTYSVLTEHSGGLLQNNFGTTRRKQETYRTHNRTGVSGGAGKTQQFDAK